MHNSFQSAPRSKSIHGEMYNTVRVGSSFMKKHKPPHFIAPLNKNMYQQFAERSPNFQSLAFY